MKFRQAILFLVAMLFAVNAYSGNKTEHKMKVKVIAGDGDGESVVVIDSDQIDFDMRAMQLGENQSIVDKNGRNVLVTRTEDGYTFDVDGRTIEIPLFEEFSGDKVWVHEDGERDVDVDVRVIRDDEDGPHQVRVIRKVHEVHEETE